MRGRYRSRQMRNQASKIEISWMHICNITAPPCPFFHFALFSPSHPPLRGCRAASQNWVDVTPFEIGEGLLVALSVGAFCSHGDCEDFLSIKRNGIAIIFTTAQSLEE